MISTTGTSIETYLNWVRTELEKKDWGEVALSFIINNGQVVDVRKVSMDHEHFQLKKKE